MASDTATAPAEVASSGEAISPLAWRTLAVVLVGLFMGLLDTTIVNVALPSIGVGLRASSSQLAWVVSGYAMAFGLMLIPAGRLGDAFGHRRMYAIGLSVFALASLVCGLTQNPTELVAARVVQGIAAGSFYPTIAAFIQSLFAVPQRKRAFGVLGAVIGVSTAVGPLLGGFIIELAGVTKGWRWVFLVNVPIGLVAVPLALRLLPDNPDDQCDRQHGRFDLVGLLLFWLAGWLALLLPLVEGQDLGWPLWTWLSLSSPRCCSSPSGSGNVMCSVPTAPRPSRSVSTGIAPSPPATWSRWPISRRSPASSLPSRCSGSAASDTAPWRPV